MIILTTCNIGPFTLKFAGRVIAIRCKKVGSIVVCRGPGIMGNIVSVKEIRRVVGCNGGNFHKIGSLTHTVFVNGC